MPGVIDQLDIRKLLAFGTGIGVEIRAGDLEVAAARVRPSGIEVLGRVSIRGFRQRPAAEWGAEYARFLRVCGAGHLSATVLLPRQDVIVRQVSFPGVSSRHDLASAIALELDTLHPYGEDNVQYGWTPLGRDSVLIGMLRRTIMEQYAALFNEAGVAVASFTFSAGVIHAAIRLLGPAPAAGFVAVNGTGQPPIEIYGESPDRPLFSGEFDLLLERVVALAVAELRLDPATEPLPLERILPAPRVNPVENDLSRDALPYAAALAGACPRLAPVANLLPADLRAARSRAMFIPSLVLAALLLLLVTTLMAYSKIEDERYLEKLQAEIAQLEPQAARAQSLDRRIDLLRVRSRLLDEFRARPKSDLDALNELTRLLPPPVWTNQMEINRDAANINGEADQAAALLGILDGSPLFHDSKFDYMNRSQNGETFRVHTMRGPRK
jgi:Tfp pilus assembly protein PilN